MDWDKAGVPHKGWSCVGVEDIADSSCDGEDIEYERCEMCGQEKIRFVHIMRHPEYPYELRVGCICAEKMSDDYVNPRRAEDSLRNRALRRKNFDKTTWNYNPRKNTYSKKYKGEYITIMQSRYGNWGIFFAENRIWDYNGRKIRSMEDANRVAFEIFEQYHTTQEERDRRFWREQAERVRDLWPDQDE